MLGSCHEMLAYSNSVMNADGANDASRATLTDGDASEGEERRNIKAALLHEHRRQIIL